MHARPTFARAAEHNLIAGLTAELQILCGLGVRERGEAAGGQVGGGERGGVADDPAGALARHAPSRAVG